MHGWLVSAPWDVLIIIIMTDIVVYMLSFFSFSGMLADCVVVIYIQPCYCSQTTRARHTVSAIITSVQC